MRAVLIDDDPAIVDEKHVAVDAREADGLPLEEHHLHRRRQRPPKRRVANPRRREQPPPPPVEIRPQQALTAQAVQHGEHVAARQALIAVHDDAIDLQHPRVCDDERRAIARVRENRPEQPDVFSAWVCQQSERRPKA